jgi:hypothetical protein
LYKRLFEAFVRLSFWEFRTLPKYMLLNPGIFTHKKKTSLTQRGIMKYFTTCIKRINAAGLITLLAVQSLVSQGASVKHRIMCLGDSIKESENRENSWRYMLVQNLYKAGYKGQFDMVGRNSGFRNNPDTNWDSEHCGYYSARADQLLNGKLPRNRGSHGCIKDWAPKYKPTIALIHLGTNDSRGGQSPESTLEDIEGIIGYLRAAVPEVKIVVAQIIPIGKAGAEKIAQELNSKIPAWAESITTKQSPVEVVDMHSDMEIGVDQGTYHPIGPGSQKMADKWFTAIEKWFKKEVSVWRLEPSRTLCLGKDKMGYRLDGRRINPSQMGHYYRFMAQ